jgi:hypothetical protein
MLVDGGVEAAWRPAGHRHLKGAWRNSDSAFALHGALA